MCMHKQDREEMSDGEGSPVNVKQQLGVIVLAILLSQQLGSPRSRRKGFEHGQAKASVAIKPPQVS